MLLRFQKQRLGFLWGLCCGLLITFAFISSGQRMDASQMNWNTSITTSPARPVTLFIPRIGVEASILSLGKKASGDMDVPKKPSDVSWYKFGSRPGDIGNAVIAGHLDTAQGKPAIFWRLNELKIGDIVVVQDEKQQSHLFRVREKKVYPYDQAPLQQIFGKSEGAHLNLITCDGTWNVHAGTYTERVVIYTERIPANNN